jgi:hypothetical protein
MTNEQIKETFGEEKLQEIIQNRKEYYKQHREERLAYQKKYDVNHNRNAYFRDYMRHYNKYGVMFSYCIPEQIEQIENYELAKKDNFKGWHIHHRLECIETGAVVNSTRQDLIDWGIYFNRPANELIFLTGSEHIKLHNRKKNREGL